MSQVTFSHLLAEALKAEFGGLIRADDDSDWQEAADGIMLKIERAMEVPKIHSLQYTEVEVNLVDMILQNLGWDPNTQTRHHFLSNLEKEVAGFRASQN